MPKHLIISRCSRTTAMITFLLIASLFCLIGCAQLYKLIGLTDQQTDDQLAADQTARQQIIQGIRITTTDIIITTIAGIGAIASGFLARALGTEKKINKAMIAGIQDGNASSIQDAIQKRALAAGVEDKLHARVKALT